MPKWLEGTLVIGGISIAATAAWLLLFREIEKQKDMSPCSPIGGVRQADGTWLCNTNPESK